MALALTMSGSGQLGEIAPGWSISEQCTPVSPGDTAGSAGQASLSAGRTTTSRYVADNPIALTHPSGTWRGRISTVNEQGLDATVSVRGGLGFLVGKRTMPPVWFDDINDAEFAVRGSGTGQVAALVDIAIDPVDGGVLVASVGSVNGVDRTRIIKFDAAGTYVTEFGANGTGNGQFATSPNSSLTIAVSPVDQAVWVGDPSNYRIQKFTTANGGLTYSYAAKVGAVGTGNGQFISQTRIPIAVDASGNAYASDRGSRRIQKFNSSATYQAQSTALSGLYLFSPEDIVFDPAGTLLYATIRMPGPQFTTVPGRVIVYNTSFVIQDTIDISAPAGSQIGITNLSIAADGTMWAAWNRTTFLVQYDLNGTELSRWQWLEIPNIPTYQDFRTAAAADGSIYVMFPYGVHGDYAVDPMVGAFNYQDVLLSEAIQRYMEACDPNLNGYTFDYQAASDPAVVFPGWTGDVWAKMKELCTAYNVELALVNDVIVVRDVGAGTLSVENNTPIRLIPSSNPAGRAVEIVAQNPIAGGGIMWDAAAEDETYSIEVGKHATVIVRTNNSPVDLVSPRHEETLPILPGQYHVVDSQGLTVSQIVWASGGGHVDVAIGESPGTIKIDFYGPKEELVGFTGPYYFATGRTSTDIGALSIAGNGVRCSPETVTLLTAADPANTSQDVAFTLDSPFFDTRTRVWDRGVWAAADAAGPNVTIQFNLTVARLNGLGLTTGAMITHESSRYRVTDVSWGDLEATVTATRHVTLGEVDTAWVGQTLGTSDSFWAGYSAGDRRIQPLLTQH